MHKFSTKTINQAYGLISSYLEVLNKGEIVGDTSELRNISIDISDISDPLCYYRKISIPYVLGELVWYFSASNSLRFISKFSSVWEKLSDDGRTSNSSYGYILKYKHGFDQIRMMIRLLKEDPNSRRAVININVPNRDVITTKDEPCTIALQFLIRDGKLHMTAIMRSNDIWFGFPYDVVYFTTIQKYIARELGIPVGEYTHFAVSLHMYIRDSTKIRKGLMIYDGEEVHNKIYIDYLYIVDHAYELYKEIDKMKNPKDEIVDYFMSKGIVKILEDNDDEASIT